MLKFSENSDVAEQQMNALIFYLVAIGYIDGDFDRNEKTFIRGYIADLVVSRAEQAMAGASPSVRKETCDRFIAHFHRKTDQIDNYIKDLLTEVVADEEDVDEFINAKLKLRSYEIFCDFDRDNRLALLDVIDAMIHADGNVHPAEAKFRDEIHELLNTEIPLYEENIELIPDDLHISDPIQLSTEYDNHPIFLPLEHHYSADPEKITKQASADRNLIVRTMQLLDAARSAGEGKLNGAQHVSAFDGQSPFLDGHIIVHPRHSNNRYELIVLGDLHGCYSCLKAAVLQSNFFAKVEAYRRDPQTRPNPKLVLLGDYIDRGHFSLNGVLRTVMRLYCAAPDHVIPLRGNHEFFLEYRGRIYGGVRPAEAIATLYNHMPAGMFEMYKRLFESLPNVLFFDRMMFVHAGIPRERDLREKWVDLSTLNDPELRFQMLWSDPSQAKFVPEALQAETARFSFGQRQFEAFMAKIGCTTLIRGHEKITKGFMSVYKGGSANLFSLFSAGGTKNKDLPSDSSYRDVSPMAITIHVSDDSTQITPWHIDYEQFNDPKKNLFFATVPEIEHKIHQ